MRRTMKLTRTLRIIRCPYCVEGGRFNTMIPHGSGHWLPHLTKFVDSPSSARDRTEAGRDFVADGLCQRFDGLRFGFRAVSVRCASPCCTRTDENGIEESFRASAQPLQPLTGKIRELPKCFPVSP
jgi:hypothetical protein